MLTWKGLHSDMSQELTVFFLSLAGSVMNNLQLVFAMLLVIIVSACFLGRYISLSKKLVISSFGIFLITIICTVAFNVFFGEDIDSEIYFSTTLVLTSLMFIYSFVFYLLAYKEKRLLRAIEATICLYLFSLYISNFSQLAVIYLAGGTPDIYEKLYYENFAVDPLWLAIAAMSLLVTLALFFIAYLGFYRPKKFYIIGIPYRILFIVWLVLFVILPFIPAVVPDDEITIEERYQMISLMFGIGIILLGLAVPVVMIIASAERTLREKNKSQESYLAAELEYIGQYKKQQVETRAFRHDIKNNLAIAHMMLEQDKTDEARAYISDMLGNVSALSPKYVTGDEMLDIIIAMKADKMNEMNIAFTLDGVVDGGLKMKPMDMCSIFANSLDNAIEAASKCENPFVSFSIKRTDKFFVIKITNSASEKIDTGKLLASSGYTSKDDKEHHGFGLMNIRRAVDDYNGMIKAESSVDSFSLSIMMPRSNQQK